MIRLNELESILLEMENTSDVKVNKDSINFKYNNGGVSLTVQDKGDFIESKMILMSVFRSPKKFENTVEGDKIAEKTNLTTLTPCKVIYVGPGVGSDGHGFFLMRNVFTDKLNNFADINSDINADSININERLRRSNIKVLILAMMIENNVCYKDIYANIEAVYIEAEDESK